MKNLIAFLLIVVSLTASAQSESFQTLKEKFHDSKDVTSINLSGILFKTILLLSGEDDFKEEFGVVKSIRIINIPQQEFHAQQLKLSGFKKFLKNDSFDELMSVREENENLTVYVKDKESKSKLYFFLIEEPNEVTAIEIKGDIIPNNLLTLNSKEKISKL